MDTGRPFGGTFDLSRAESEEKTEFHCNSATELISFKLSGRFLNFLLSKGRGGEDFNCWTVVNFNELVGGTAFGL